MKTMLPQLKSIRRETRKLREGEATELGWNGRRETSMSIENLPHTQPFWIFEVIVSMSIISQNGTQECIPGEHSFQNSIGLQLWGTWLIGRQQFTFVDTNIRPEWAHKNSECRTLTSLKNGTSCFNTKKNISFLISPEQAWRLNWTELRTEKYLLGAKYNYISLDDSE